MKKILFVLVMAMFAIYAKAQLYSSEVHFYIEAGADISNGSTLVEVVKFEGNHVYVKAQSVHDIKQALRSNSNYYDTDVKKHALVSNYDSSLSTTKRVVYKYRQYNNGFTFIPNIDCYYAYSKDKSSLIEWTETYNGERLSEERYYIRINKAELMPKATNRDFLYE